MNKVVSGLNVATRQEAGYYNLTESL